MRKVLSTESLDPKAKEAIEAVGGSVEVVR